MLAINHTIIHLGLISLSSQRFDYNHILDKFWTCNANSEDPTHYSLPCPTYAGPCPTFFHEICDILSSNNFEVDFRRCLVKEFFIQMIWKITPSLSDLKNANTGETLYSAPVGVQGAHAHYRRERTI